MAKKFSFFKAHRIGAVPGGFGRPTDERKSRAGARTAHRGPRPFPPATPWAARELAPFAVDLAAHAWAAERDLEHHLVRLEAANEHDPLNQVA